MNEKNETIVKPAILVKGEIFTGRIHCDCYVEAEKRFNTKIRQQNNIEGFVTSEGRYVSRVNATLIAIQAGQVPEKLGRQLLSTDLW